MAKGDLDTAALATHHMPLADSVHGYDIFKKKHDGCIRAVFAP